MGPRSGSGQGDSGGSGRARRSAGEPGQGGGRGCLLGHTGAVLRCGPVVRELSPDPGSGGRPHAEGGRFLKIVELAAGGLLLLIGVRSAVSSIREVAPDEPGRVRALIALHEAAKAGFWLALGAFFLGYATV